MVPCSHPPGLIPVVWCCRKLKTESLGQGELRLGWGPESPPSLASLLTSQRRPLYCSIKSVPSGGSAPACWACLLSSPLLGSPGDQREPLGPAVWETPQSLAQEAPGGGAGEGGIWSQAQAQPLGRRACALGLPACGASVLPVVWPLPPVCFGGDSSWSVSVPHSHRHVS